MNRQEEINVLQSLKEDTYFAQIFKPDTIDAMCRNIENDFPLDCGIELFENCQSVIRTRNEVKTLRVVLFLTPRRRGGVGDRLAMVIYVY